MKILKISDKDLCPYGDYLNKSAADMVVSGDYTHVEHEEDGGINEVEVIGQMSGGWPMVLLGFTIN